MMFRNLVFLALWSSTSVVSSAQQTNIIDSELDQNIPEGKLFLSEEYLSFEETVARVREQGNSFLRRGLQSSPACRAQSPLNKIRQEGEYCSALAPYPCGCTGIAETACNYCALRPEPNHISCQVSGSLITFLDHTSTVTTCGCEYLGNGQLHQFCYQESGPVPIPPPAVVIEPAPQPTAPRASLPAAPAPTIGAGNGGGVGGGSSGGSGGNGKGSGKGKGSNRRTL